MPIPIEVAPRLVNFVDRSNNKLSLLIETFGFNWHSHPLGAHASARGVISKTNYFSLSKKNPPKKYKYTSKYTKIKYSLPFIPDGRSKITGGLCESFSHIH